MFAYNHDNPNSKIHQYEALHDKSM